MIVKPRKKPASKITKDNPPPIAIGRKETVFINRIIFIVIWIGILSFFICSKSIKLSNFLVNWH